MRSILGQGVFVSSQLALFPDDDPEVIVGIGVCMVYALQGLLLGNLGGVSAAGGHTVKDGIALLQFNGIFLIADSPVAGLICLWQVVSLKLIRGICCGTHDQIGAMCGDGLAFVQSQSLLSVGQSVTSQADRLVIGVIELHKGVGNRGFILAAVAIDLIDDQLGRLLSLLGSLVDGEGVHHAHVSGAIGGDGELVVRDRHLGYVGHLLLILYGRVGELHICLNSVILAAGTGVGSDVQDAIRIGNCGRGLVLTVSIGVSFVLRNLQAVHHVGAAIDMVMTHQNHINSHFLHKGRNGIPQTDNTIFRSMTGHGVDRVVESYDFPVHSGVCCNARLYKFHMVCNRAVVGIDYQEQGIVVNKGVVAACSGCTIGGFIGYVKVLVIGVGFCVVIANDGCKG